MRILNHIGFEPYWGRPPCNVLDLDEGSITVGGGEEAGIRAAAGLRALGHEVTTYWYGMNGVWRGVEFCSLHEPFYPEIVSQDWDAVIGWSSLRALEWAQKRKDGTYPRRIFAQQLNDLFFRGDWSKVDCIVSPSKSHAEQLKTWGWHGPHAVVHNGIDPEKYANAPAWETRPLEVGYWSSPDRGLHHLLSAWPSVVKVEPRAKLRVMYEIDRYLRGGTGSIGIYGDRARILARLVPEAKRDPSVTFHGAIPRNKLAGFQKQCRVQCYPLDVINYCEGYGTSLNQGIAAGCQVLTTRVDAFPELYDGGVHWLDGCSPASAEYPVWLAKQIVLALHGELPDAAGKRERGMQIGRSYSWLAAAKQIERACKGEGWVTP